MHFYDILSELIILMRIMQQICVDIEDYARKLNEVWLTCWLSVFYGLYLLTIGFDSGGMGLGLFQVSIYLSTYFYESMHK